MIRAAFTVLTHFRVEGAENLPEGGPLMLVGNHFSFIDPVAMIRATPWPVEILGGHQNPGAPVWTRIFPKLWGVYPLFRGTGSRRSLRAAESVLGQGGVLGIFPEGGNWATVLRPPRPGAAYLATCAEAPIVPMGFDGLVDVFPQLGKGHRAEVTVRIGQAFGPFRVTGRGRDRRRQLDAIGDEMMQRIAALIPPERRGHYSEDPAIREAARGTEIYPWAEAVEGELGDVRW
jgi:1-acyl-sn-glycerol-3-phosphate acyltransferase